MAAVEEDLRHARLASGLLEPGPEVREALQVHVHVLQAALRQGGLGGAAVRTRRNRVHHHGAFDHHGCSSGGGGGAGQPADGLQTVSAEAGRLWVTRRVGADWAAGPAGRVHHDRPSAAVIWSMAFPWLRSAQSCRSGTVSAAGDMTGKVGQCCKWRRRLVISS